MSSKTKIVVLHMKELIYTGIFVALGILFISLLVIMFLPDKKDGASADESGITGTEDKSAPPDAAAQTSAQAGQYIPGVYSTQLVLNDQTIDVEVIVDQESISSIRMVNLSEAVTTMYPLLQPAFDSICEQIYATQSLENITYQPDSKYTSLVLLEAIRSSLEKAAPNAAPDNSVQPNITTDNSADQEIIPPIQE